MTSRKSSEIPSHDGRITGVDMMAPYAGIGAGIINKLRQLVEEIKETFGFNPLTALQRRRMRGTGIRKWGFIMKTVEVAASNMQYAPGTFNKARVDELVQYLEALRVILVAIKQVEDIVDDNIIFYSNELYTFTLLYYTTVRDLARHGDQGAQEVFNVLRPFFRRGRMTTSAELTDAETMHKVKSLLDGKTSGKIVVEGKEKHMVAGEHAVIDETYKAENIVAGKIEGIICDGCNTHNPANARFCFGCGKTLHKGM